MFTDLERERERETETSVWERNIHGLPPVHAPTGDRTCNLDICPDWESKLQPFGVWDNSPKNWAWPRLAKFIIKCILLFFDTIVNQIVFLILGSLLVYWNAAEFLMFSLDPITLLNSCIISNCFLVESLGFSTFEIMPSVNRLNCTFRFKCV